MLNVKIHIFIYLIGMPIRMFKPELLSPAGDVRQLVMSLTYGADAVYFGGRSFGLRAAAGNFSLEELADAITMCHTHKARAYITCNAIFSNDELCYLPGFLEEISSAGADAVIVSDIGALSLAKKYAPSADIHISTQAGVFNYASAQTFYDLGASRIILARELPLYEIARIREKTPAELELEAFVHGSMCVAVSGRCLLSHYLTGRNSNRGECAQPCRWKYSLMEEQRPGEYFDITGDDSGTYIMNSRDLCMIGYIKEMSDAGISALKIEGRAKSEYYAAVTTNAYRHAIDSAASGLPLKDVWREEVDKVSHREYSTGFYFNSGGPGQFCGDSMYRSKCEVVAIVESCDCDGNAVLTQRNKFSRGDELELLTPISDPVRFITQHIADVNGYEIDSAPHPMMKIHMKLPIYAQQYSILRKYR
jgi:putative protease